MKVFDSFFLGGFECADIINNRGHRVDMLAATYHDVRVEEDYQLLAAAGITTVREGIRWSIVEKHPFEYDFAEVINRMQAAEKWGIQIVWDICHFGYPDGLMPAHPHFEARFVALCKAFAFLCQSYASRFPVVITPVNEISFISWLGGEARGTIPFSIKSGFDVKYFLCKAVIKAIEAIKSVDPSIQIMMVEPLVRVHPQMDREPCHEVLGFNDAQFQAMDIITGRICTELGGRPEYMDLAGFNYYYNNQWEHGGPTLGWCKLIRRTCFSELLKDAYHRYNKPVVVSETGHFKEERGKWMQQITEDCITAMQKGVDLKGICIYPVLDRPDWDHGDMIACGIWSYDPLTGQRFADAGYLRTVEDCNDKLQAYMAQESRIRLTGPHLHHPEKAAC